MQWVRWSIEDVSSVLCNQSGPITPIRYSFIFSSDTSATFCMLNQLLGCCAEATLAVLSCTLFTPRMDHAFARFHMAVRVVKQVQPATTLAPGPRPLRLRVLDG